MKFVYIVTEDFDVSKAVIVNASSIEDAKEKVIHYSADNGDGTEDMHIRLLLRSTYGKHWFIQELDSYEL